MKHYLKICRNQCKMRTRILTCNDLYIFVFKTVDGQKQYAEVLVNDKTGSRHIR